jgi:hypothetical protein
VYFRQSDQNEEDQQVALRGGSYLWSSERKASHTEGPFVVAFFGFLVLAKARKST